MDKALVESVLELPPNERVKRKDAIVTSLDRPDSQIDNIWLDEAQKRLEAFKAAGIVRAAVNSYWAFGA